MPVEDAWTSFPKFQLSVCFCIYLKSKLIPVTKRLSCLELKAALPSFLNKSDMFANSVVQVKPPEPHRATFAPCTAVCWFLLILIYVAIHHCPCATVWPDLHLHTAVYSHFANWARLKVKLIVSRVSKASNPSLSLSFFQNAFECCIQMGTKCLIFVSGGAYMNELHLQTMDEVAS